MSLRARRLLRFTVVTSTLAAAFVTGYLLWSASTPELDSAERAIRERLEYVSRIEPEAPREYLAALAVNTYVAGHVSASEYGYLLETGGAPPPTSDRLRTAERALASGAGICGEATAAALSLYARLGILARQILVTTTAGGHVTTEVFYGGAWHWFDPTFNYFYRQPGGAPEAVYSIAQVMDLADPQAAKVGSDARLWTQITIAAGAEAGNGLEITDQPSVVVTTDDGNEVYRRDAAPTSAIESSGPTGP